MITKDSVKRGDEFKRPNGNIVIVKKIEKAGFHYEDKNLKGVGGWHSFNAGKYLQEIK